MTDSEKALAAALDKGGFKPKPRPNSTKAVHALHGAHALLAKALLYVKQAKDELGDVRIREPMVYPLITDVDAVRVQSKKDDGRWCAYCAEES